MILLGGEGFIGTNIIAGFTSIDTEIIRSVNFPISIARTPSVFRKLDPYVNQCKFISCDLYKKDDTLLKEKNTFIYLINGKKSIDAEINIASKISEDSHLIVFSSAVVYANPFSDYGTRKSCLEDFYKKYCKEHNINLTILRLFNSYGKYQIPFRPGSLVSTLIYNYLNHQTTKINDLEVKRDFLYAGDLKKIINHIVTDKIFGTYDLAIGKMCTVADLIHSIEEIIRDRLSILHENISDINCPNATNIVPLPFKLTDLDKGLTETVEFYEHNFQLIKELSK